MKVLGFGIEGADTAGACVVSVKIEAASVATALEIIAGMKKGKGAATAAAPAVGKGKKKASKVVEEEEDEEEEDEDEEEEEEDEDEEEEEDEDEEPAAKGKGAAKTLKITDDLKSATKLREVISAVMKQGFKSKKDITAVVLKLKPKLKVLQTIADLETRLPRAIELVNPDAK